jgi:hypothetical protein
MRKFLLAAAVCTLLFVPGARASTQDFTIDSFSGDYYISRDASNVAELRVTEKIVALFPQSNQNHGILRAIPEDYQNHPLELKVQKVTDARGTPIAYDTSHDSGNLVLKIGDADTFVHGEQTYNIEYTMRGVTLNLDDHEEFFWDSNGDQWGQQFKQVQARVHIPADIATNMQERTACYAGSIGSTAAGNCVNTRTKEANGDVVMAFATKVGTVLEPRQTMTVVLGFNKGTFAAYTPSAAQVREWAFMAVGIAASCSYLCDT